MTTNQEFPALSDVLDEVPKARYEANRMRPGEGEPCVRCGLPVKDKQFWLHLTTHGFVVPVSLPDFPTEGAAVPAEYAELVNKYGPSQGWFPLGSECAKKKALRPYVVTTEVNP